MKAVYIKNFRKGFATNSSSTHSVIYRKKEEMFEDLNIFELDYYGRCDNTIAATKSAKIKYIAGDIMHNKPLLDCMCAFYPEMKQYLPLIGETIKENKYGAFGNHSQALSITSSGVSPLNSLTEPFSSFIQSTCHILS